VDGDASFSLISALDKEIKKSLELVYERKCGASSDEYYLHEMILKSIRSSGSILKKKFMLLIKRLRWSTKDSPF
jgi:spore coat protein H